MSISVSDTGTFTLYAVGKSHKVQYLLFGKSLKIQNLGVKIICIRLVWCTVVTNNVRDMPICGGIDLCTV
jgi:hypothetical protein